MILDSLVVQAHAYVPHLWLHREGGRFTLHFLCHVGSMGNGHLAVILANHGAMFGAIIVFLYADFNGPPAVKINANYYGRKFALYLADITAILAILGGIGIHVIYTLLGRLTEGAKSIQEMSTFGIDYTFWLNIFTLLVISVLIYLHVFSKKGK